MLKPFNELVKIDVEKFCVSRPETPKIKYLNWAKCIDLLYENGATFVKFEPEVNVEGHTLFAAPYEFKDSKGRANRCYEVRVNVTIDDKEYSIAYPVMNGTSVVNDETMNQLRVHNAITRAFVKCVAVNTGLGLSLWIKDGDELDEIGDNLDAHKITSIKKRIEKRVSSLISRGMDISEIAKKMGMTEKQFKAFMDMPDRIAAFEKAFDAL